MRTWEKDRDGLEECHTEGERRHEREAQKREGQRYGLVQQGKYSQRDIQKQNKKKGPQTH